MSDKPDATVVSASSEGSETRVAFLPEHDEVAAPPLPEPSGGPIQDTELPAPAPGRALPPPGAGGPLSPGVVLSSTFEIEQLVARGGMGEVYRARHRITGDPIAIKTIRPELAGTVRALPAVLSDMYNPSVRAATAEARLEVRK